MRHAVYQKCVRVTALEWAFLFSTFISLAYALTSLATHRSSFFSRVFWRRRAPTRSTDQKSAPFRAKSCLPNTRRHRASCSCRVKSLDFSDPLWVKGTQRGRVPPLLSFYTRFIKFGCIEIVFTVFMEFFGAERRELYYDEECVFLNQIKVVGWKKNFFFLHCTR